MFLTKIIYQIKTLWDYVIYPSKYYSKKYAKYYIEQYRLDNELSVSSDT